jgi:hypothetical protein
MGGANDFRRNFRKNEDGEGDGQRAGAQRPFFVPEQFDGDDADQHGSGRVDQVVAEQDDAEHLVGLVEQVERLLCAVMTGLGEMPRRKRLDAIMAVSLSEKKAEMASSTTRAVSCADRGISSTA